MSDGFDVAIVGLGAMGSAAAAHLAARGVRVVGFEAAYPAHPLSSSHGDSRLIRLGYFEDPAYVPLLRRAYENWRKLEQALREEILTLTGVLQIGAPDCDVVLGTKKSAALHGLTIEMLDRETVRQRHPAFTMDEGEVACFDPQGGYLRPERAIAGHVRLAAAAGAQLHFNEAVEAIEPDDAGVTVVSAGRRLRAAKVIVATGPWISRLVPALRPHAVPIKQVVAWYQPEDGFLTVPGRMPSFIRDEGEEGSFFGFPVIGPDGYKVGRHLHLQEEIDPDQPNPPVNDVDLALIDDFIARRIPTGRGRRSRAVSCRYTMLPGETFLIDTMPGEKRIVVASPCSGHGFKFVSVIGEILADLAADGETGLPIAPFSFSALAARTA
ncbi:N-methyl-L-tryptophan oxidase [Rhizobium sp. YIM 134829]|uniref:N-methyl-L-tryptophan oxidase n=1 Tax=Rhizobium sp. YIM 134829 TaxID=3390453 RepID=UPI00397E83AA